MKKWSSQWTRFMQLRREASKKFRTSTGFEPVTSRYRCDALPTELWSHWRWEPATNHFTWTVFSLFFGVKGAILYYVAIAKVIFSHVKITCYFHMWRYQVFARKLTWYFIGVYIINRRYYMAAWRNEISLRVLNYFASERSEQVKYFPAREEKFRISQRP